MTDRNIKFVWYMFVFCLGFLIVAMFTPMKQHIRQRGHSTNSPILIKL